jgi:hypothetical protein
MKRIIVVVIILSCHRMSAQSLTGTVCDKVTKQPIPDVYVYLDGTSINDITTDSGRFELAVKKTLNTKLVLHHVSYHTVIIENPFGNIPAKLYMEERLNVLRDVTVQADRFTRAQKLNVFREQFLGMTKAGKSCKIMNEDDIRIWFNPQEKTLSASSDQPIIVVNEYLGYKVLFTLVEFRATYTHVSLNRDNIRQSYFAVTTSYTDLNPNDKRIKKRRDEVYEKSSAYFFRNFANNTLEKAGFKIYKDGFPIDHRLYFNAKDTLSLRLIRLIPDAGLKESGINFDRSLLATISVLRRRKQSDINLFTDSLLVDQYGNIDKIDKVMFSGEMGQNQAGGMLPIEYEP